MKEPNKKDKCLVKGIDRTVGECYYNQINVGKHQRRKGEPLCTHCYDIKTQDKIKNNYMNQIETFTKRADEFDKGQLVIGIAELKILLNNSQSISKEENSVVRNFRTTAEDGYNNADVPMGVSQWKEHGKRYGYDKYFHKDCISKEEVKELRWYINNEKMLSHEHKDGTYGDYVITEYNKLNQLTNKLNQLTKSKDKERHWCSDDCDCKEKE